MPPNQHSILLHQPLPSFRSRTFYDFESRVECVEEVFKLYESYLKEKRNTSRTITYTIDDLCKWIDDQPDMSCLLLNKDSYDPYDKYWIKEQARKYVAKQ